MEKLFLNLVNYSLVAGWLVLAILLVRLIFKKVPKWIICILWAMVAVRLICPFSIESIFSLVPSSKPFPDEFITTATPFVDTGFTKVDQMINPIVESSLATPDDMFATAYRTQGLFFAATLIWIAGLMIMILYAIISSLILSLKLRTATLLEKGIKQSDRIGSPFVFGIFRPYIYLPYNLKGADLVYVEEHEKAHIKRRDYLWKPLGFVILSVYWFNPLIWVAYIFLCRDIEAACDERVVNKIGDEKRSEYSAALLNCSIKRRMIAACPIAFGETGVKSRIRNIMNYKKPAFWVLTVSLAACTVVAVCFLTNPEKSPWKYTVDVNSDAWTNMSLEERYEACRIPQNELNKMSDEELVQAVNDYPFLLDLLAVDSIGNNEWANIFASRCDAFARLKTKENAVNVLSKFIEDNYSGEIEGEDKLKKNSLNMLLDHLKGSTSPVADADTYNEELIGKGIDDRNQSTDKNTDYSSAEKIMKSFGQVTDIVKTYKLDNWHNKSVSYCVNDNVVFDLDINFSEYKQLLELVDNVKLISEKCSFYPGDSETKLTDYVVINATEELSQAGIVLDKMAIGEKEIYIFVHEKDGKSKVIYMPYKNGYSVNMAGVRGCLFNRENFDEYATNMSAGSHKNIFEIGTYQNNTGYYVDLNGDGVKEELLVARANKYGGNTGEIIYLNGECVVYQGDDDGILPDKFSIIDVDTSDGQMEILIDSDMSAYSGSRLYSYQDGKLVLLGELPFSLMKNVGEDFYNRIVDSDRIPGDGTLLGYANFVDLLQDNLYADITLKLNREHTGFVITDELFYPRRFIEERGLADENHYYKLRCKVCVASDMDSSTIDRNNVIEKGNVIIDITDGKRWIHVKAVDGNTTGGWIDMDDLFEYILEETDPSLLQRSYYRGDILFENLNHAG